MIPDWMTKYDLFIDIHDTLRPYSEARALLEVIERTWKLKSYFNGSNLGGRWIFQVFSQEFVTEIANIVNTIIRESSGEGPVVEVMSGDGVLTDFLKRRVERPIIATDAKSPRYRIAYPKEVETIDAMEAVRKYNPAVVIACWEPHLSMTAIDIVRWGSPLIWIGDPQSCGHPDLFTEHCKPAGDYSCIKMNSKYALGRHDSLLKNELRTDIYVFNCDESWFDLSNGDTSLLID
ncbi:MAG: hypothetical protein ACTSX3_00015 [Candidatus Thorarchaeota archaeon]